MVLQSNQTPGIAGCASLGLTKRDPCGAAYDSPALEAALAPGSRQADTKALVRRPSGARLGCEEEGSLRLATAWAHLEGVRLSEESLSAKDKHCTILFMLCGI